MNTQQRGVSLIGIIFVFGLLGVSFVIKDESGVSYGEQAVAAVKYYTIDRNEDAMNKAQEAKDIMQGRQVEIQAELDN